VDRQGRRCKPYAGVVFRRPQIRKWGQTPISDRCASPEIGVCPHFRPAIVRAVPSRVLQPKRRPFLTGVAKAVAARLAFHRKAQGLAARAGVPRLDTSQWNLELLKRLEWRRFEELCVAYYEALELKTRVTGTGSEGGVHIVLYRTRSDEPAALARCIAWDAYRVGLKPLRALRKNMADSGIARGVLLTSSRFTHEAATFAANEGIELIDGPALLERLNALPQDKAQGLLEFATEGDFLTPTCPFCSIKMVPRQSTREGWKFWGCRNYPACKKTFAGTPFAPD
jgi:hypothetical protein